MSENKETKQEVTNEQILEHLKELEMSQGAIVIGISTIFCMLEERAEELKLNKEEIGMIRKGQIAMAIVSSRMADISGMNEIRKKEKQAEVHIVRKEDMKGFVDFLDFLKEIFE